jgi:hypothetical protein
MPTGYCTVASTNFTYENITSVSLNGSTQNSAGSTYTDYTSSIFTTLNAGSTYTLSGTFINDANENLTAYFDWNANGTFDIGENVVLATAATGVTTFTSNITVPTNIASSEIRMRIMLVYNVAPSACTNFTYGEVEDYKIVVNGWTPVAGTFAGSGMTGNVFTPSVAGIGGKNVTFTYTNGNGCTNTDTATTMVNALPTLTLPTLAAVCVDAASFALTGAAPSGGNWSGMGVASNSFNPATAGVGSHYLTYTFTDANTCTNSDSTIQVVNALPTLTMPTLAAVCVDASSFALTGAAPSGGNWSGIGVATNSFNPATAGAGSHYVKYTYTDANTCTNKDSVTQVVNALPIVLLSGLESQYCVNSAVDTLSASPIGGAYSGNGITNNIFDPSTTGTGSVNVIYSFTDANTCTNSDTMTSVVYALPVVNLGLDATLCASDNTTLDAGAGMLDYLWNTGDTTQTLIADSTYMGIGAAQYTVVVTSNENCVNTDTIVLTFEAYPVSTVSDTATLCGLDQSITLTAATDPNYTYLWSNTDTTNQIVVDTTTLGSAIAMVHVSLFSPNMCQIQDSVLVWFREVPMVSLGSDTTICNNHTITFDALNANSSYLWSTGETTQTITLDSNGFDLGNNAVWVLVTNQVNCTNGDTVTLIIDPCTGLETPQLANANILVYPNPSKGMFDVEVTGMQDRSFQLGIYNVNGAQIFNEARSASQQEVQSWNFDLRNLAKGVYIIRIQSDGMIKIQRIVIQ